MNQSIGFVFIDEITVWNEEIVVTVVVMFVLCTVSAFTFNSLCIVQNLCYPLAVKIFHKTDTIKTFHQLDIIIALTN